jgi:hypothetical protein
MSTPGRNGVFAPMPGGEGGKRTVSSSSVISGTMRSQPKVSDSDIRNLINTLQSPGGREVMNNKAWAESAKRNLSPEDYRKYALGINDTPAAATPASGGSGGVDANALMEMYQKGLGAGANSNSGSGTTTRSVADELALLQGQSSLESAKKRQQTDDQLRLLREGNNIDLARKRVEHNMQMEGQRVALDQTQRARAKERETEAQLQRRQQSTERGNAMAAYRGL